MGKQNQKTKQMKTVFQLGLGAAIFSMTEAVRIQDEISNGEVNHCQELGSELFDYTRLLCNMLKELDDQKVSGCKQECPHQDKPQHAGINLLSGFKTSTCEDMCDIRFNKEAYD